MKILKNITMILAITAAVNSFAETEVATKLEFTVEKLNEEFSKTPDFSTGKKLEELLLFTWTEINDEFYFEFKNGTQKVFKLDNDFWMEGYNLTIRGYDNEFKNSYTTSFFVCLDRGPVKLTNIEPGESSQTKVNLKDLLEKLPESTKYVDFTFKGNDSFYGGTKLPEKPLTTTIYKIKPTDRERKTYIPQ